MPFTFKQCTVTFYSHPEDGLILHLTSEGESVYVTVEAPICVLRMGGTPFKAHERLDDGTPEQAVETLRQIAASGSSLEK